MLAPAALVWAVLCGLAAAAHEDVLVLTGATFDAELRARGRMLVKFYAPWCGHCKALAPKWDELAGTIEGVTVAELDCTDDSNREVCNDHHVAGFPTIMYLEDTGARAEYKEARDVERMRAWTTRMTQPPALEYREGDESKADVAFILAAATDAAIDSFQHGAAAYKGVLEFFYTPAADVLGLHADEPSIVVSKLGEDPYMVPLAAVDVSDFVRDNRRLLVTPLSPDNFAEYAANKDRQFWITFVDPSDRETTARVRAELVDLARQMRDMPVSVTILDGVMFAGFLHNFGEESEMPFTIIFVGHKHGFIRAPAGEGVDLVQWVQDAIDGKLEVTHMEHS